MTLLDVMDVDLICAVHSFESWAKVGAALVRMI